MVDFRCTLRNSARQWIGGLAWLIPAILHAQSQILLVTEDTWIHSLNSSASQGSNTNLSICPTADYWIYLKFDLSTVTENISGAELHMTRFSGSRPEEISLYFIPDDTWTEVALTGQDRPDPVSPPNETAIGVGEDTGDFDRWAPEELTTLVRHETAGDGIITLMVREDPGLILDVQRYFSREGAGDGMQRPQLVLTLLPPAV
jgi:hypothetical protein